MHSTDTKSKFLEFRGKGWSLARIAKQIDVSVRTLADWNQQHRQEIRTLRAIEIEALQEKFLATHEQELSSLTAQLQRIEQAIADSKLQFVETKDLFRLAAVTRAEIRKVVIPMEPDDKSHAQN
jgi:transposase